MYSNLKALGKYAPRPTLGVMCHFAYDAKLKLTLPYWDLYPLVIPADYYNDGMLGWNLHYVPQRVRKTIVDQLWKYAEYDPHVRLKASYYFIKALGALEIMKPCIKRYLYTHCQSQFLEIEPANWYKVLNISSAVWAKRKPYPNAK